jgi:hypothetical protein
LQSCAALAFAERVVVDESTLAVDLEGNCAAAGAAGIFLLRTVDSRREAENGAELPTTEHFGTDAPGHHFLALGIEREPVGCDVKGFVAPCDRLLEGTRPLRPARLVVAASEGGRGSVREGDHVGVRNGEIVHIG